MDPKQILKQHWGFDRFRPKQEEIIRSVLNRNDTLALLPTGGGKSICFQVPGLAMEGITVVISPLIALMKDQVENLRSRNVKAIAIHSALDKREVDILLDNCVYGDIKFLYLAPERIETTIFRERLKKMKVNLLAVDEAHCISQWGYDFRPSYRKISALRELIPDVPVIALTATATPEVVKDIQEQLGFRKNNVIRKSYFRSNLAYKVRYTEDKDKELLDYISGQKGTGIVYARNRKRTQEISRKLSEKGISADFYHAGLEPTDRDRKQNEWVSGKTSVVVCTNAFGMGIDKPDVRFVVHYDVPENPESYFQEAGRGGRDEKYSEAILLFKESDPRDLESLLALSFPELKVIRQVYQVLGNYFQLPVGSGEGERFPFDIGEFSSRYNLHPSTVYNVLKLLERENYITLGDSLYQPSRIKIQTGRDALYNLQVSNRKIDGFVKLLLRSYTGLFEQYTAINEFDLARKGSLQKAEVIKNLGYLQKMGVISYLPQTKLPYLGFTTARMDAKDVELGPEVLKDRKERAKRRLEAMLRYVGDSQTCRSRTLLAYFGEDQDFDCLTCDVCLGRQNKTAAGSVRSRILKMLEEKSMGATELFSLIPGIPKESVIEAIRVLLDENKIKDTGGGKYDYL